MLAHRTLDQVGGDWVDVSAENERTGDSVIPDLNDAVVRELPNLLAR
jgi:hypothetical protein